MALLPLKRHSLQLHIIACSPSTIIRSILTHNSGILRLHGPLPKILRSCTIERLLPHSTPLLEVQATANENDHQRVDDDIANDGMVVARKDEAEDAVDQANSDYGGAKEAMDFAEESGLLVALVTGMVDNAGSELSNYA